MPVEKDARLKVKGVREPSSGLFEVISDKGLARLGDSYLNFLYSMALSEAEGKPTGARLKDRTLVEVAKATGIRSMLPNRTPKGRVADSIEALIVYTLLRGMLKFEDMMEVFRRKLYDPVSSLEEIVREAVNRLT